MTVRSHLPAESLPSSAPEVREEGRCEEVVEGGREGTAEDVRGRARNRRKNKRERNGTKVKLKGYGGWERSRER